MVAPAVLAILLGAASALVLLVVWRRPEAIVAYRAAILGIVVVVSLAAAATLVAPTTGAVRLRLDPSEEPLLPRGDPARLVYADAVRNFGDDDLFVIGMTADDVFTAASLRALRRISDRLRRLPGVRGVESLVTTTTYRWDRAADLLRVEPFIEDIPEDPAALAALRARALADRLYRRTLVSPDGRTAALNVSFRPMSDREFVDAGLDEAIATILADETTPERRFFVTGRQHVKAQAARFMVRDLVRLIPLAVLVGAAVAGIATGSLRAGVLPVATSLVATLWTMAALVLVGRSLNLITLVLAPMLICVGSVYGVHVLARFEALRASVADRRAAAVECIRDTRLPVLISGVTTVIGFAALLVSSAPAVREFGGFSLVGVALMTVLALTAFPALLAVVPAPADGPRAAGGIERALDALLTAVARLTARRSGVILGLWTVVTALALAAVPRILVDTDYLSFFDPRSQVRRDFATVSERLVGPMPIYVVVSGGGDGAFREPENLRALARLQAQLNAIPEVSATLSLVDFVAVANRALERDDAAAERVPDTRAAVSELVFLLPKAKVRRFVNANQSRANIVARTGVTGSSALRALETRLRGAVAAAGLSPPLRVDVTGNAIVLNRGADAIAGNQLGSVALTTVTILVLVTAAFRSLSIGLVAMAPNLVPVILFFGLLGGGIATLSLPTSLIGCVALGIAIDDTAHFLVSYRRVRGAGTPAAAAIASCVRELGQPIVVTSLMLSAGYLVLALSSFTTVRQFGWLSALTMQICLWGDLLMLPSILVRARI